MKKALFLFAAVLTALSVFAADVAVVRSGDNYLTLHDTPCTKEVTELLKPEHVKNFNGATDHVNGKVWKACWILSGRDAVFVVYEDGDSATVPIGIFELIRDGKPVKPAKPSKGSV